MINAGINEYIRDTQVESVFGRTNFTKLMMENPIFSSRGRVIGFPVLLMENSMVFFSQCKLEKAEFWISPDYWKFGTVCDIPETARVHYLLELNSDSSEIK